MSIYNEGRSFDSRVRALGESDLRKESIDAIIRFVEMCAAKGLTVHRQNFYLSNLRKAAALMGPAFTRPARADVEKAVAAVERQDLEEWTKANFRVALKRFYKWLLGNDEEYPPEVKWIRTKPNGARRKQPSPSDLLTRKDVEALIRACLNPRDKALVSLLFDSGCRIGEVLTLRLRNVEFDRYGMVVSVIKSKTGQRRVRVIGESIAHASAWLEVHPLREDRDAPVFVGLDARTRDRAMNYAQARKAILSATARAGLKKRVFAHLFRHSRATELAATVPEAPLEAQMGWVPGSDMTRVYVHLSGRDVDRAILKAHGIEVEERETEGSPVISCPRCSVSNARTMRFCRRCGLPLDVNAALELERALERESAAQTALLEPAKIQELMSDPRVQEFLRLVQANQSPTKAG